MDIEKYSFKQKGHVPMAQSGYLEKKHWSPTESGTPQGDIISPVIANMVLDGLEEIIKLHARHKPNSNLFKINFVRYAGDFVVTCINSEYL